MLVHGSPPLVSALAGGKVSEVVGGAQLKFTKKSAVINQLLPSWAKDFEKIKIMGIYKRIL